MKKIITSFFALGLTIGLFAQTAGTLTFNFTQVAHSPCYSGSRHVLAVWIQTSTGTFVKTKLRRVGSGTSDHLPTWAGNASCSSSTNATSTACNTVSATTGATLSSFGSYTITWDGTNASGTVVTDGAYRVAIQETWNHGGANTVTTYYNFTKGTTAVNLTPTTDANFSAMTLMWVPASGVGINEISENPEINVYPNPSTGIFNVDLHNVNTIKVLNTLGALVYQEKVNVDETKTTLDLSSFGNGIYFIAVTNDKGTTNKKIILSK